MSMVKTCVLNTHENCKILNFKIMLEFLLMLLGLAFPNSDANNATSDNNNQVTIENLQTIENGGSFTTDADGDTGGETPLPPKK